MSRLESVEYKNRVEKKAQEIGEMVRRENSKNNIRRPDRFTHTQI